MASKPAGSTSRMSAQITAKINQLNDWRGETLARMRKLIHDAVPEVAEEMKWGETPVWEHNGILCTGETNKSVVKLTFAKGAALKDPNGLFNSSLEGKVRCAIDIREGEKVKVAAFKALMREAVAANAVVRKKSVTSKAVTAPAKRTLARAAKTNNAIPPQPGTAQYDDALVPNDKAIADLLARTINRILPEAENKIWHAVPVWFLDGNPVVGYGKLKHCLRLLFWSGQSFDEPNLVGEGSFKAAEARYTSSIRSR